MTSALNPKVKCMIFDKYSLKLFRSYFIIIPLSVFLPFSLWVDLGRIKPTFESYKLD